MGDAKKKKVWWPFTVTESQVINKFQDFLQKNSDKIPIDAVINAKIERIEPQFHLFLYWKGPYTAHWKATCYWERKEEYTEPESKTVFVDSKTGQEYDYAGEGRTPISKIVSVKKTRTVLDNMQCIDEEETDNGAGLVDPLGEETPFSVWAREQYLHMPIEGYSYNDDTHSISKRENENQNVPCPELPSSEVDENTVIAKVGSAHKAQLSQAKERDLPGTRHKDFQFLFVHDFQIDRYMYFPFYKVIYSYTGKQYEVWFFGRGDGEYFYEKYPENSESLPKLNKSKKNNLALATWIPLLAIAGYNMNRAFLVGIPLYIFVGIVVAITLSRLAKYTLIKSKIDNIQQIHKQLSELVDRTGSNVEEQKAEIQHLVEQHAAYVAKKTKGNRRLRVGIYMVAICAIAFFTFSSMHTANMEREAQEAREITISEQMQQIAGRWERDDASGDFMNFTADGEVEAYIHMHREVTKEFEDQANWILHGSGTYAFGGDDLSFLSVNFDKIYGGIYALSEGGDVLTWGDITFYRHNESLEGD